MTYGRPPLTDDFLRGVLADPRNAREIAAATGKAVQTVYGWRKQAYRRGLASSPGRGAPGPTCPSCGATPSRWTRTPQTRKAPR